MLTVLLVIHVLIALALIVVVLLQRSEGGGLGIGGGGGSGGGMAGFMTGRGTANLLTRTTAILAACFMLSSIALTILSQGDRAPSLLDEPNLDLTVPPPPASESGTSGEPTVPTN